MLLISIATLLLLFSTNSHETDVIINKCCASDMHLMEKTINNKTVDGFECVQTKAIERLEIITNSTNFVEKMNQTEEANVCVDVTNSKSLSWFELSNRTLIQSNKPFKEKLFNKCCPMDHFYNSRTHSCTPFNSVNFTKNQELLLQNFSFVRVGVPQCRVVTDYNHFKNLNEIQAQLRNMKLKCELCCVDQNEKSDLVLRVCGNYVQDVCEKMRCIRKCCPDGQSFVNGSICVDSFVHGVDLGFTDRIAKPEEPFAIIHKYTCNKIFHLKESRYAYSMDETGVLKLYYNKTNTYKYFNPNDYETYCIEHAKTAKMDDYSAFLCYLQPEIAEKYTLTYWAKIFSCVCLVLTIFAYLVLNEMRNLFGKALVNYCLSLLFNFGILCYSYDTMSSIKDKECVVIAYLLVFTAFGEFTWLNVICWDIWCTFGKTKLVTSQKRKDIKKFIYCSTYAWGLSILMVLLLLYFTNNKVLPDLIHPTVGLYKCFINSIDGNYAVILFKDGPLLLLQLINTGFFIKTVMYCIKVKNEINKMNDTNAAKGDKRRKYMADKERLSLMFKLSVIMGLSFLFEVLSAFYNMKQNDFTKYLEIVWDTINCLQGVFVFIIFICKRKVYVDLRDKLNLTIKRKSSVTSITNVQTTSTFNTPKISVNKLT